MPTPAERLAAHVPLLGSARCYRREDFGHDLVAGLVVAVITVPQALGYAFLAGLPPQVGLYACLAPLALYALLGSSRQLVVGPVAVAALMVAAAIGEHASAYPHRHVEIAAVLSLQVGLVLWLLRLGRMGGLASLLSHPVIAGFVNAAAILIIISQLAAFAGFENAPIAGVGTQLAALADSFHALNGAAVIVGVASLALLFAIRRHGAALLPKARPDHPLTRTGPILVAGLASWAVVAFELGIDTVGAVPAGLPSFSLPPFDQRLWWDLTPNAVLIALVAFAESYSVGRTLAARQHHAIDANQELTALGAANAGAAFLGAYPVAGSFSRSSVNQGAGARTQVSALVCAVAIVLTLMWLTPLFAHLPRAALGAIVVSAVWGVMDFGALRQHWRLHRPDAVTHLATFAGVLATGVETGLLIGVGVSVALFLRNARDPHIAVLGRLPGTPHFRNVERFTVRTRPDLIAARVDESLFFANAEQVEARLLRLTIAPAIRHLVLVMPAVNFVDASALGMLQRLARTLARRRVTLHFSDVKGPVRDQLQRADVAAWLTGRVFATTDDAVNALAGDRGKWVWRPDAR